MTSSLLRRSVAYLALAASATLSALAGPWTNPVPPPTTNGVAKCWFGVHDPNFNSTHPDDSRDLLGSSNITFRNFSVSKISAPFPTSWWGSQADVDDHQIMITITPTAENTAANPFNLTLSKLADPTVAGYSTWEQHIKDRALQIKNWKKSDGVTQRKVLIRLMHEMNGRWFFWGQDGDWKNGRDPHYKVGNYIKAWKHIVDVFETQGATNASFVWCPSVGAAAAGGGSSSTAFDSYFPGSSYVHWIGGDGYNTGQPEGPWKLLSAVFDPWLNWIINNGHTAIPAMLAETGSDEPEAGDGSNTKAAWVNNAIWALKNNAKFQQVKIRAFVHQQYNDGGLGDWRCNSPGAGVLSAYQNMVQDSFFKH